MGNLKLVEKNDNKQDSSSDKLHDNFSDILDQSLKEDYEVLEFLKDKY